jgi:hypothetical protein
MRLQLSGDTGECQVRVVVRQSSLRKPFARFWNANTNVDNTTINNDINFAEFPIGFYGFIEWPGKYT